MLEGADRIGVVAAEIMESCERRFGGDDGVIEEVLVIAAVRVPDADPDEFGTYTITRCSNPRAYVQRGLAAEGLDGIIGDD